MSAEIGIAMRNQAALNEAAGRDRLAVAALHERIGKLERDLAMLTIEVQQSKVAFQNAVAVLGRGPTSR